MKKKIAILTCFICMIAFMMPTQVDAKAYEFCIRGTTASDEQLKEIYGQCTMYYGCVAELHQKAIDDVKNKKISQAPNANHYKGKCAASGVTAFYEGNVNPDAWNKNCKMYVNPYSTDNNYCWTRSIGISGKQFDYSKFITEGFPDNTTTEEVSEKEKKCEDDTSKIAKENCDACQKCIDEKGREGYDNGKCKNDCTIKKAKSCSSRDVIDVGGYCKLNVPDPKTPVSDEKDKPVYDLDLKAGCEMLSDDLLGLLADVYHLIRGAAIVLVVVLGVMDFIKATASNDADALKKAGNKFMKRIIVLAILIMLPTLIEFVMSLIYGADKADACLGKF